MDLPQKNTKVRVRYDPRITLGNLLTIVAFVGSVIALYINIQISIVEIQKDIHAHHGNMDLHMPLREKYSQFQSRDIAEKAAKADALERKAMREEFRSHVTQLKTELKEEIRTEGDKNRALIEGMTTRLDRVIDRIPFQQPFIKPQSHIDIADEWKPKETQNIR